MAGADSGARTGGLLTSLKQLVATLVTVVQTLLELLASTHLFAASLGEFAKDRDRLSA